VQALSHPFMDASRARQLARFGGMLYLIIIVIGALGEGLVRGSIVVGGDAAATAANLRAMETLWRVGIAGEIVLLSCATALTVVLYLLLRPVSRDLALGAVLFNVACVAVEAVAAVSLAEAMFAVSDAAAMAAITAHSYGFGIALIFFGVECVILGHLIVRSGYMPRTIGRLMQVAGVCYLINSFALILSPALSSRLFPAILMPALIGELSLALWLLIKGVRSAEWNSLHFKEG
jgi:hypothetical protein